MNYNPKEYRLFRLEFSLELKKTNKPKQTLNSLNTKFGVELKDQKSSYQVRQMLAVVSNLIAQISG